MCLKIPERALTIKDEFFHGAVNPDPTSLDGICQRLFKFVWDEGAGMPTRASIQHVEDYILVDEQEVALDLLVEGVRDIHTAHVVGAWCGPHAAYLAGIADLWDQIEDCIRDSDALEEATHHSSRSVPPSHMQLP